MQYIFISTLFYKYNILVLRCLVWAFVYCLCDDVAYDRRGNQLNGGSCVAKQAARLGNQQPLLLRHLHVCQDGVSQFPPISICSGDQHDHLKQQNSGELIHSGI